MKLLGTLCQVLLGVVFAALGSALALWLAALYFEPELAMDAALWTATNSPLPLTVTPAQFASGLLNGEGLIPVPIAAVVLCVIGFNLLRAPFRSARPADLSSDGKGRLVLKSDAPRVGVPLAGHVRLLSPPKPEHVYRLELQCRHYVRQVGAPDKYVATAYYEQMDMQVAQSAEGWIVPFRFEIPASAPPTGSTSGILAGGYSWTLGFKRADRRISSMSDFALRLGPATTAELSALEDAESPGQKAVIGAVGRILGRASLLPHERAQINRLPPEKLAQAAEIVANPVEKAGKVVRWFLVAFFGIAFVAFIAFIGTAVLR